MNEANFVPLKVTQNDPTAGIVHVQGTTVLHFSMLVAMISIDYEKVLTESHECFETYSLHRYMMTLTMVVHSVCAFMMLIQVLSITQTKCCSKGVGYGFQTLSSNLSMITIPLYQGVILYLMDALYKDQEGCSQYLGNMDWWVRIEVYTFFAYLVIIICVMIKSRLTHVGVVQNQNIASLQIAIFFEYLCT